MEKQQWEAQPPEKEATSSAANEEVPETKEWRLITRLVDNINIDQRRARRWGILFKSLTFVYLFALLGIMLLPFYNDDDAIDHVAVIDVLGPIAESNGASTENLLPSLVRAFKEPAAKAVILNINSPGGSPVVAGIVYDEIRRQQGLYPYKPVYAVIGDIGTSGAYYIAAAADYIYADKASLLGSIGVISSGFGFDQLMQRYGVERRAYVAGEHKAMLDPFQSENPQQRAFYQNLLNEIHEQFIAQVRQGRGDRLAAREDLFSGLIWTGAESVKLGLTDGLGDIYSVARDQVGLEELLWYGPEQSPIQQFMDELGANIGASLAAALGLLGQQNSSLY